MELIGSVLEMASKDGGFTTSLFWSLIQMNPRNDHKFSSLGKVSVLTPAPRTGTHNATTKNRSPSAETME